MLNLKKEDEIFEKVETIKNDENYHQLFQNSDNDNINFALNIKRSMLNGYLFLSKKIESAQLIKKNEDFLYNSFEEILIKITNRN